MVGHLKFKILSTIVFILKVCPISNTNTVDPLIARASAFWPTAAVGGDPDSVSLRQLQLLKWKGKLLRLLT